MMGQNFTTKITVTEGTRVKRGRVCHPTNIIPKSGRRNSKDHEESRLQSQNLRIIEPTNLSSWYPQNSTTPIAETDEATGVEENK